MSRGTLIGNSEEKKNEEQSLRLHASCASSSLLKSLTVSATAIPNLATIRFANTSFRNQTGATAAHSVSPTTVHRRRKEWL